jgi:hypothetical protein
LVKVPTDPGFAVPRWIPQDKNPKGGNTGRQVSDGLIPSDVLAGVRGRRMWVGDYLTLLGSPLLLTLLLSAYLIVDGVCEVAVGLQWKPASGWGWMFFG